MHIQLIVYIRCEYVTCYLPLISCCSGRLSWEQVLKFASLRKKYISVYALLLKSNPSQAVVDDNDEVRKLDRELDIDLVVQWRWEFNASV